MVTIKARDINRALKLCKPAIFRRSSSPILRYVLIECTGSTATLTATDLDTRVSIKIPAQGEFAACIDPRQLMELYLSGDVTMDHLDDDIVLVECDGMSAEIRTLPVDDFPCAVTFNKRVRNLSRHDITHCAALLPFVSSDESREILTGIGISEGHTAAATDTHRLGVAELSARGLPEMIVPGRAIRLLNQLLPRDCNCVKLQWSTDVKSKEVANIKLSCGDVELVSRAISGKFPNWRKVAPKRFWDKNAEDQGGGIRFGRSEFVNLCAQLAGPASRHGDRITFQFRDNEAFVTTGTHHDLCVMRRIPCQYPVDTVTRAFNARYLLGIAQFIGGDEIVLNQAGSDASPVYTSNDLRAAVLMPMQYDGVLEMPRRRTEVKQLQEVE